MLMVFLLCLSTSVGSVVGASASPSADYGIIFDAGSSGTKLKVYKWTRAYGNGGRVDIEMIHNEKFKPDISYYAYNMDGIKEYLSRIVKRGQTVVPSSEHSKTQLYFMATAGLRIFPSSVALNLVSTIRRNLSNRNFCPFPVDSLGVRILSGEEEGVYAWVAANYLRNFFWSNKPPGQAVGVLEMGGGSTQIAFLPDGPIYANMFPVRLAGRTYNLYAHSYLFYGQNYMLSRINDYLILNTSLQNIRRVDNPCMLSGDNTSVSSSSGNSVQVVGSGDPDRCLQIIHIFLQSADQLFCHPKPCAIGRTYQPPVGRTIFYAISAFVYTPQYLGALDAMNRLNTSFMRTHAKEYCKKSLQRVLADGVSAGYASEYCAMGLYIPSLLVDAYGIEENTTSVYATQKIGDTSIDWAMGAMLLEIELRDNTVCDISGSRRTSPNMCLHVVSFVLIYLILYSRQITFAKIMS